MSCRPRAEEQDEAAVLAVTAEDDQLRLGPDPGHSGVRQYLNGHAGGLRATLDDQQEAPVLIILRGLELEHGHLS